MDNFFIAFGVFFSILSQVLFWTVALLAIIRICRAAGQNGSPPLPALTSEDQAKKETPAPFAWVWRLTAVDAGAAGPDTAAKTPYAKILLFALAVRLFTLILGFVILFLQNGSPPSALELFHAFRRGDSNHYINIAEVGYTWTEDGQQLLLVFFPFYGYLIRIVNLLVQNYMASAYLVSFASFALGLCYLYRLLRLDYSESIAWWALILISVAPHSFFFGVPMTESLFLLTTAMTLYYIRTQQWLMAGAAGALAAYTRMVGLILIVVAAVEFATHYRLLDLIKKAKWAQLFQHIAKKGLWILLMLFGPAAYLFINWQVSGDPFRFLYYQENHWYQGFHYWGGVIMAQFEHIARHDPALLGTIFVPNILAFALAIAMLAYASLKRLNLIHIVYLLGYTFVSFSLSWLLSGARYMVAAIPLFLFLAHFAEKRPLFRALIPLAFFAGLLFTMNRYLAGGPVF